MEKFTISQIAQFTGVKPHTLRIWEQRYNVLEPIRSKGNTRYYTNSHLRRLLNIVSLKNTDFKVSELCTMPDKKLYDLVRKQHQNIKADDQDIFFVSQLISAGMNYDELHFDKIFSHCLLRYGVKKSYSRVLYPVLDRLGLLWTTNDIPPAQEHFISNLIRQKLSTAIDSLPPAESENDTWLLFLPEDEIHEIGLLFAHYLIGLAGRKVIYLGANLPLQSLKSAVKDIEPDNLLFFLIHYDLPENVRTYLEHLKTTFPEISIYLSGNERLIEQLKTGGKVQWLKSFGNLERMVVA